jgi:hypothetical protein
MPKLLLPLIAALAVGGAAAGGGLYLATRDAGVEEVSRPPSALDTPEPSPTVANVETPTPAVSPTATLTSALQTYRNEKYAYEVRTPAGYRLANSFIDAFTGVISNPSRAIEPEDYTVFTALSPEEEEQAVQEASQDDAIGLAAWFNFDAGRSVDIFPLDVLYPGVTLDAFLTDVHTAGVVRMNSGIRDEMLTSGEAATRLTRREVDDNGDFTYDMVIVMPRKDDPTAFIMRILKTPGYESGVFEAIFRSFAID